jgi:gas vesicle protein
VSSHHNVWIGFDPRRQGISTRRGCDTGRAVNAIRFGRDRRDSQQDPEPAGCLTPVQAIRSNFLTTELKGAFSMSYAGPAGQKNSARESLKRPGPPRPSSSTERNVAFLTGAIVGAVVAASVALLLAPRSGRSTRRRLLTTGRRVTRRGRDAWHDLGDEFRHARGRRRERQEARRDAADARDDEGNASANEAQRKSFSFRAASSL